MHKCILGQTQIEIPLIGQGTWQMGGGKAADRQAIDALRLGIDLGMTLIDTAEMYGDGHAERLVGEAIADCRDRVFVVSKVLPSNASYEGTLAAARRSLERMRLDTIDLYLLHWPSDRHPVEETMRAMEQLADEGAIRTIGVSNFGPDLMRRAQRALTRHPLVCNQVLYYLNSRGIERRLLPLCQETGVTLMAYSPLGQGDFPAPDSRGGRALAAIGRRHGKTPQQVALNWVVRHAGVVAIPKASNPDHVRQNAAAVDWTLSDEDLRELDRHFAPPDCDEPLDVR